MPGQVNEERKGKAVTGKRTTLTTARCLLSSSLSMADDIAVRKRLTKLIKRITLPWESFWLWTFKMIVDAICFTYGFCLTSTDSITIHLMKPLIGCITLCLIGVVLNLFVLTRKTHDTHSTKYILFWDVLKLLMGVAAVLWIGLSYRSTPTKEDAGRRAFNILLYAVAMLSLSLINLITLVCVCVQREKPRARARKPATETAV